MTGFSKDACYPSALSAEMQRQEALTTYALQVWMLYTLAQLRFLAATSDVCH